LAGIKSDKRKNIYINITEANIDDYPGFYIGGENGLLTTLLSPLPGEKESGTKVRFENECTTPWRVVMVADNPGQFIESELIRTLNPPCTLTSTKWIKPGKCAWDHWWSGEVKMENDVIREYIDFAAEMKFPYMLIDWQWYGPYNEKNADITRPAPQLDWQGILDYAKEKNVKLWLWLYCTDVNRNDAYKKAFALYEKWGIAGVKIDFMDRSDQYMVNWYRRIVDEAAKHHLMLDMHGAYKPDGIERTYPNFLTREGVMGNEYNKWNNGISAEHNVKLAFTRMLAGPMDYTPGGFLNVRTNDYKAQSPTLVPNTRCAELAKFVIYDSPFTVICDHPRNILGKDGAEFLKIVPTEWDDTRFLQGSPDSYIAMAKRNGNEWFVGAMNNSQSRNISLNLSFLPKGKYEIECWTDANQPDAAKHYTKNISSNSPLKIKMAENGGFVAVVRQIPSK
jgi:alpha-glucosidase